MVVGARYSCMCSLCDQMHGCFVFLLVGGPFDDGLLLEFL